MENEFVASNKTSKFYRSLGRLFNQIRPVRVTYDAFGYAAGAVLFEIGNTKVLCAVSIAQGVPPFLKGSRTGWLTAEYAMLPTSTVQRVQRESFANKKNGRCTEISRLIGRAMRAVTQLDGLGERTITIDCDVLQADGGTRTAAISGACLALRHAQNRWLQDKIITAPCLLNDVAAISVGILDGVVAIDLDCSEDNVAEADFNFVLTSTGNIIELQGAVEKCSSISWENFGQMSQLAVSGVQQLFSLFPQSMSPDSQDKKPALDRSPFFSLKNRFKLSE